MTQVNYPYITQQLTELLAIKLYEHDHPAHSLPYPTGHSMPTWLSLPEDDRQTYRAMAQGMRPLPSPLSDARLKSEPASDEETAANS